MCWPIVLTVPNRDSDLAIVMPETYWTFSTNIKQFAKKNRKILERSVEIVDPISLIWQMNKQGLERFNDLLKIIGQVSESAALWFPFQGSLFDTKNCLSCCWFQQTNRLLLIYKMKLSSNELIIISPFSGHERELIVIQSYKKNMSGKVAPSFSFSLLLYKCHFPHV